MPYDFLIGNKSRLSPNPFKGDNNYQDSVKKEDRTSYQESLRKKLSMDPKSMFLGEPPSVGLSQYVRQPTRVPDIFPTVTIGSQTWMAENLDITTLYDGTPIVEAGSITGDGSIGALTLQAVENGDPLWCWREFDSNGYTYGNYGKWYSSTVVSRLISNPPPGWRVPSIADWNQLKTHFDNAEGGYIKGPDNLDLWDSPYYFDTTAYFNAVPSGFSSLELASLDFLVPPVTLGTYNARQLAAYWTSDTVNYSVYYVYSSEIIGNIETFLSAAFNTLGFSTDTGKYGMVPIRLIKNT